MLGGIDELADFLDWMRTLPAAEIMRIDKLANLITVTVAGRSITATEDVFLCAWKPPYGNVKVEEPNA